MHTEALSEEGLELFPALAAFEGFYFGRRDSLVAHFGCGTMSTM
jgi:hypothetical protein